MQKLESDVAARHKQELAELEVIPWVHCEGRRKAVHVV